MQQTWIVNGVPGVEFPLLELELLGENGVAVALRLAFVAQRFDLLQGGTHLVRQRVASLAGWR